MRLVAIALIVFVLFFEAFALSEEGPSKQQPTGKEVFTRRCGSCHDADGSKPLSTGLPLNRRKLSKETIALAVDGRLKSSSQEERSAVKEYIQRLLK